jgi:hypothetical protein
MKTLIQADEPVVIDAHEILFDLMDACDDAAHVLGVAARVAESPHLVRFLEAQHDARETFAEELAELALELDPSGTIARRRFESAFERTQRVFERLASERGDDLAVIDECVRVESEALRRYRGAESEELPPELSRLCAHHAPELARAHAVLSAMREGLDHRVDLLFFGADAPAVLKLRELLAVCERSAQALHDAATRLSTPYARATFAAYAQRREYTVGRLASMLLLYGAHPPAPAPRQGGSRALATDGSLIDDCRRSEAETLRALERARDRDLPVNLATGLGPLHNDVEEVYAAISRMCASRTLDA